MKCSEHGTIARSRIEILPHLTWLVVLFLVSPLAAQRVGDRVIVVVGSEAELKIDSQIVGTIPRGASVKIKEVGNGGFTVAYGDVRGHLTGKDVLSIEEAIPYFTRAITSKHRAADYYGRGNARLEKHQFDKALADYDEAIRLNPTFREAFSARGLVYLTKGDADRTVDHYKNAIADYTEAIRLGLKDSSVYGNRGVAFIRTGDLQRAIADLTDAIRLAPKDDWTYNARGAAYYEKDDFDRAIADYTEAIRLNPEDGYVYCNRGIAWQLKGDYGKAIADYTEAIQRNSTFGKAFCRRGAAWSAKGDFRKSIADFTKAIRLGVRDADIYCGRGTAYLGIRDWDKAGADFAEAIRLDPRCRRAYLARGGINVDKGDCDKAIADFTEAIHLDAKDAMAYFDRGAIYTQKGDLDLAIADYTEAIKLQPRDANAYLKRGEAWLFKKEYDKAIADFDKVLRRSATEMNAYLGRSCCYKCKGDLGKAISDLDAAVAISPNSPCLHEKRGAVLIAQGHYDCGIADIETAIRLNPRDQATKFEAWPKAPLSGDALCHGQRQLAEMLQDRKAMEQYGNLAEPLYQWAIQKFAGEDLGEEVFWNSDDPPPYCGGCNYAPTDERPGSINVRETHSDGKRRSFEEVWSTAVFELYNIANIEDWERLHLQALSCCLSKEQYVVKAIDIESRAAEKTRSFYIHVFVPWAKQYHITTDPSLWFLGARSDPSETLILHAVDKRSAYWLNYENAYGVIIACAKTHDQKAKNGIEGYLKSAAAKREKSANHGGIVASGNRPRATTEKSASTKRIEPLDVLTVWGRGTLLGQPIQRRFLVEPSGKMFLGPAYGRVEVAGLTLQEAEAVVKKHLENVLKAPDVEILAAGRATQWPGEAPKSPYHIRPKDLLKIEVFGTLPNEPIYGDFLVAPSGEIALGEPYGTVMVKGLTLEETEQAITKHLSDMLQRPKVSVSLSGWKR
jgi:tetratricopeptide (TPR) repeat protein/protein involved in polysaccharide export with SLBB domain